MENRTASARSNKKIASATAGEGGPHGIKKKSRALPRGGGAHRVTLTEIEQRAQGLTQNRECYRGRGPTPWPHGEKKQSQALNRGGRKPLGERTPYRFAGTFGKSSQGA